MRYLIYKELYLGRKRLLLFSGFSFVCGVLGILVRLSMICGNMKKLPAESLAMADKATYLIFEYVPFLIFLFGIFAIIENVSEDYNCKWSMFAHAAPVEAKQWVFVKYFTCLVIGISSFVYGVIYYILLTKIARKDIHFSIIENYIIIVAIFMIITSFGLLLIYRFKKLNIVMTIFGSILAIASVLLTALAMFGLRRFEQCHPELPKEMLLSGFIQDIFHNIKIDVSVMFIILGGSVVLMYGLYLITVWYFLHSEERG